MTHTSVERTQETINSREFTEWLALYEIDPWGDDWAQAATVTTAALSPWTKRRLNPQDFIPGRRQARRQSREEVAHRLKLFFNNVDKRQDN